MRSLHRRWLAAPAIYLGAFLAVSSMGCADRLLLHPTRGAIAPPLGSRAEITFRDGVLDVVRFKTPRGAPRARVIVFTGNGGRAEFELVAAAQLFDEQPVELIAVNPPGYGRSSGAAELESLVPAAISVYDALEAEEPKLPVIVYGNSMGGAVALGLAVNRSVVGVVLRNPPPLRKLILVRHGWWNLWLLAIPVAFSIPSELDALHNAPLLEVPVAFLRASRDEIVPPTYQAAIFDRFAATATLIEYDGGHNDPLDSSAISAARAAISRFVP